MILLYSSHGEAAEVYKLCKKKIPDESELMHVGKVISEAGSETHGLNASVLDRREIKALVQRSDPRFFLLLRELSVHLKRAYEPSVKGLSELGYYPAQNVLVRLCEGADPIEILAVGVLAALCGVKDLCVSLDRATITPEIAAACRLCGIESVILCDEISSAGIAAYGSRTVGAFSRFVCVGSALLGAACGMTGGVVESIYYQRQSTAIFAQFVGEYGEALTADVACLDKRITPVIITSSEELAHRAEELFKERDGIVLFTSSDEETCAILEKCRNTPKRTYGNAPVPVCGVQASKASPLMLSVTSPESVYPYKPTDFLLRKDREADCRVTAFAGSIAAFVEKSLIPDEEIDAIGVRLGQ